MGVHVGGLDVVPLLAAIAGCHCWAAIAGDRGGVYKLADWKRCCWVPLLGAIAGLPLLGAIAGLPLLGAIAGDRGVVFVFCVYSMVESIYLPCLAVSRLKGVLVI